MKKIIFLFSLILLSGSIWSQSSLNTFAKEFIKDYNNNIATGNDQAFKLMAEKYDLTPVNGIMSIGVSSIVDPSSIDTQKLLDLGIVNDTQLENLWTFRVPIDQFESFTKVNGVLYIEVSEPIDPLLELSRPSARVDSVHEGLGNLVQAYKGKDVIIAIIDWGFDYTHPVFYDSTLSQLRLSKAWDQNKLSGPAPSGYSFGTEFTGENNLLNAESDTLYVFGPMSHGTHVAGIAGGGGAGTVHIGAAPKAELVFISLKRDAPSLLDAFSYVSNYASQMGKPFVINMSFGSHLGPHDGSSLKNLGIDIIHGPGKIFVGSAGNNGTPSANFHLDNDFSSAPNDTLKTVVNFATGISGMFGQTLSMWGSANSSFSASIALVDNSNNIVHQTPYYLSSNEPSLNDTLIIGSDSLIIRLESVAQHFLNNKPNIRIELKNTTSHKVVLHAASQDAHLHIWNNVRMINRYTNWGVPLTSNYPNATAGDNDFGLGEPAGVGKNVITVGSYRAELLLSNGQWVYGDISNFSSYGPTVDMRTKPDISSTGQNVMSSINSFNTTESPQETVDFNGKTYGFRPYSGTSMSGPMVTGIVALMLEAFPKMSATQAKEILKNTARLDDFTGAIGSSGHLQWGWGKANAYAAVSAAEIMSSNENFTIDAPFFNVYPNPAEDVLNISIDEGHQVTEIELISLDGKEGKQLKGDYSNQFSISIGDLSPGIYLIKVQSENKFSFKRIVKN